MRRLSLVRRTRTISASLRLQYGLHQSPELIPVGRTWSPHRWSAASIDDPDACLPSAENLARGSVRLFLLLLLANIVLLTFDGCSYTISPKNITDTSLTEIEARYNFALSLGVFPRSLSELPKRDVKNLSAACVLIWQHSKVLAIDYALWLRFIQK